MITPEECVEALIEAIKSLNADEYNIRKIIDEESNKRPCKQWDIAKQEQEIKYWQKILETNNKHIDVLLKLAELLEGE